MLQPPLVRNHLQHQQKKLEYNLGLKCLMKHSKIILKYLQDMDMFLIVVHDVDIEISWRVTFLTVFYFRVGWVGYFIRFPMWEKIPVSNWCLIGNVKVYSRKNLQLFGLSCESVFLYYYYYTGHLAGVITSALFQQKAGNYVTWHRVTRFSPTFQEMFFPSYLTSVYIWSQLHYFPWNYDHTHILQLLERNPIFAQFFFNFEQTQLFD